MVYYRKGEKTSDNINVNAIKMAFTFSKRRDSQGN